MKIKTNSFITVILVILMLLCLAALYYQIFIDLIQDWSTDDNYSHGFFIPFISIYMIYSIRSELGNLKIKPQNLGLLLLIAGLAQLVIGKIGSEFFVQRTSMILIFFGFSLFFLGSSFTKKNLIPILYLILMIPLPAIVWNKIAFPMQLFASDLTEKAIQLIGIAVFREGNILHLAQTSLEVVDACSGLRSLTTMFALSTVIAWFATCSAPKKWLLFIAAAPIAILCNIIRLTFTAILASMYGGDVAQGFLHEFSGFVTFALGMAMLVGISSILTRKIKNSNVEIETIG
ncbi:MAG: exosortase/archaeosortase family protein [Deltaproteobacteria bacterium]|jgi:exosortase|nr:exosortase/archaeosortase family protein [Deltaproteobacteria bacterium]